MLTLILLVLFLRMLRPWGWYHRPFGFWGMPGMWRRPPMGPRPWGMRGPGMGGMHGPMGGPGRGAGRF